MSFQVGDRVVFKTWEEMKKEYGIKENGDIDCSYVFTIEMEHAIDKTKVYTITQISGDQVVLNDIVWRFFISTDMIKIYTSKSTKYDTILKKDFSKIDKIFNQEVLLSDDNIYIRIGKILCLNKDRFDYYWYTFKKIGLIITGTHLKTVILRQELKS